MVKGPSWGKLPSLWLVKDFGILGILWGKFLFHSFSGLGQGSRESELSNVGVIFSEHSEKSCCVSLLSIDSGSELGVVLLHGMEISQEIPLFKYPGVIMPWDWGSLILTVPAVQSIKGFVLVSQGCPRMTVFLFPRSITKKHWREFLFSILKLRST